MVLYSSEINDQGIKNLNLITLNARNNSLITNVNHMTNLRNLNASGDKCGINEQGIKDLYLIELHTFGNKKIQNVYHNCCIQKFAGRSFMFKCNIYNMFCKHCMIEVLG